MVRAGATPGAGFGVPGDVLLDWWRSARGERDALPWRSRTDPWEVLVAEVMLAQTQASRVALAYGEFIGRFPTPASCAVAGEGEVLGAWIGLGYNSRAIRLQASAARLVAVHGGRVPADLAALIALPGVGPYIARAVLAFAFEHCVGVVDTNIGRVLARAVAGRKLGRAEAQGLADALVDVEAPRSWNLALMDLGALCCTARSPRCGQCPLFAAGRCAWRAAGDIEDPARGSAAVSRGQSRFRGSDREVRGHLVRLAGSSALRESDLRSQLGLDVAPGRLAAIVAQLIDEGLLRRTRAGGLRLG